MNTVTVALLGGAGRAGALRERLADCPIRWVDEPTRHSVNLLLDAEDSSWRQRLLADGLPFQVAHTDTQALRAVGLALQVALVDTDPAVLQGRGRWVCESCADPECEHRLFRDLLAARR